MAGVDGRPVRFTTAKQDREVHQLRAEHQAIMIGSNTVLNDNPNLGVRLVKGEDPLRIILDSKNRISKKAKVFRDKNYLIAIVKQSFHLQADKRLSAFGGRANIWTSPTKKQVSLKKLFSHLVSIGISSVLVEPGPTLYDSLKRAGLIDELIVYRSKKKLKQGLGINL